MTARTKKPGAADESPLRFNARLFAAVAPFRAVGDIRYYLNGVRWEPHPDGGALLFATDGHRLACAFDPNGHVETPQITPVSRGLWLAARQSKAAFVACIGDRLMCIDDDETETFIQPGKRLIEGNYPLLHTVLPDPADLRPVMSGTYNAAYIADLGVAAKALRLRFNGVSFWQIEHTTPGTAPAVIARFVGEPNFIVLTMSMREDALPPLTVYEPYRKAQIKGAADRLAKATAESKAAAGASAAAC